MLEAFADLSTPLVADACVRCDVPLRVADSGIRPVVAAQRVAGRVLPVRHYARRAADPSYTFRRHLRRIGGAIEE